MVCVLPLPIRPLTALSDALVDYCSACVRLLRSAVAMAFLVLRIELLYGCNLLATLRGTCSLETTNCLYFPGNGVICAGRAATRACCSQAQINTQYPTPLYPSHSRRFISLRHSVTIGNSG